MHASKTTPHPQQEGLPMPQMHTDRFLHLRSIMHAVQDNRRPFAMNAWMELATDEQLSRAAANQTNCGTAACTMGHAALDPWFQSLGLKLEV